MISRILTAIILVLFAAILIALGVNFKIPLNLEQIAFFVLGILAAVIFGFAWFRLNDWIGTATSPGRPQTIRLNTDDTPAQITWAAIRATLVLFMICFGLTLVFLAIMSRLLGVDFAQLLA
jgi:hypothetical protein